MSKISDDFRLLRRHEKYKDCIDILWFKIGRFHFRWFIDCGYWFLYIEWWTKNKIFGYRFSEAGNMIINHDKSKRYV